MSGFSTEGHDGHLVVSDESKAPYADDVLAQLRADAAVVIAKYPQKRSALLPLLHLVQSVDGYVTGRGVELCAELLDLTRAEVSGVATFYTQYKRHPNGEYTVGVCTNTLCAIMGGDRIFDCVSEHLGIGHDETTEDGKITLERIECNAACDYAPVIMTNWEFFDNQTPDTAIALVDDLRDGKDVKPTRGPDKVHTFKEVSRVLAGFLDGHADEGVGAGPASLLGLDIAKNNGWRAPGKDAAPEPGSAEAAEDAAELAAAEQAVAEKAAADKAAADLVVTENTDSENTDSEKTDSGKADSDKAGADKASADNTAATLFDAPAATRGEHADGGFGEGSAKPDADGAGPAGWTINVNADSMLFHTLESPWYKRTKAEVWFRDEESAKAAGFADVRDRKRDGKAN